MTVVVDIGCHTHQSRPDHDSVRTLIERHQPTRLYGFDPHPAMPETQFFRRDGAEVWLMRVAAWTHDGTVEFDPAEETPLTAHLADGGPLTVPCFDLARWLQDIDTAVVLKLDCEGAEYDLLQHLDDAGAIGFVELLLVEWHGDDPRRDDITRRLDWAGVPVEDW